MDKFCIEIQRCEEEDSWSADANGFLVFGKGSTPTAAILDFKKNLLCLFDELDKFEDLFSEILALQIYTLRHVVEDDMGFCIRFHDGEAFMAYEGKMTAMIDGNEV